MPARPPVLGASIGNTRTGITAVTTPGGAGGRSPATRDGKGVCGWVWGWDWDEDSGAARGAETVSRTAAGAAGAAGCAVPGAAVADKSAALNRPLRLRASTSS